MSVVKCIVQKDYVVIYNKVLEIPTLSLKAKGLWSYCMSRSQDWQFHVNQLATISTDGKDAIYSALKELQEHGLVEKCQSNVNGKFGDVDYIVYPFPQELKKCLPQPDFPQAVKKELKKCLPHRDFPHPVNPPLPSKDYLPSKDLKKENIKKKEEGVFFERGAVKLLEKDFHNLVKKYGQEIVDYMLLQLDLYSQASPLKFKRYKSHVAVLEAWILKENFKSKESSWKNPQKKATIIHTASNVNYSDKDMPEPVLQTFNLLEMMGET